MKRCIKEKFEIKKYAKVVKIVIISVAILSSVLLSSFLYINFRPKFRDATIELGTTKISVDNFLVSKFYKKAAEVVTALSEIDLSEVSIFDIKVSYKGKEQTVKLKIVDTTPPEVNFKDAVGYLDYEIDPNDFIESKFDLSRMSVTTNKLKINDEFKDYTVTVSVSDIYGNITTKSCTLSISWLKPIVYVELGSTLSKEMLLQSVENDVDKLPLSEMEKVDTSSIGTYTIKASYLGKDFSSDVIVQDKTPPTLELKNVTIYQSDKVTKDSFIKTAKDASGEVTLTLNTQIDYTKLGTQKILIEAKDIYENKIEKEAVLTIKSDKEGPKISGLTEIWVNKYTSINYSWGVSAQDAVGGNVNFSVNSSLVNVNAAGTYYATYTATDAKGNVATAKRKVVVSHDWADTNWLFDQFYYNYLSGKSVYDMTNTVRTKITYNSSWGGDDPVWYGLTNYIGNCYVHALILQRALNKAGIKNMLIWVEDKTHYWNIVYEHGSWRHYDSTPSPHMIGPATDTQKLNCPGMYGRKWDFDLFPKAN